MDPVEKERLIKLVQEFGQASFKYGFLCGEGETGPQVERLAEETLFTLEKVEKHLVGLP